MSLRRECFVLPGLFLTVALLGGFRAAGDVQLLPPSLMALALAMLLVGCLTRAGVLVPDALLNARRSGLANVSGLIVLLTLFAASAQAFNLVTPERGLLHLLFSLFFLVQLLTTLAAVRERVPLLRALSVLFGAAFLIRFVLLESLYSPGGGTLQRVLAVLIEGASLGALGYTPHAPITGYVAFFALVTFMTGLALLTPGERPGTLVPASSAGGGLVVAEGAIVDSPRAHVDRALRALALFVAVAMLAACSSPGVKATALGDAGEGALEARNRALASARVWREPARAIGSVDFAANPPGGWTPQDEVACRFVAEPVGGTTPKFECELADGEVVKVKYGRSNEEIYSEVAASRLLDALGFGADRMFVVRAVRCDGCPRFPYLGLKCLARIGSAWPCFPGGIDYRDSRAFEHVVIERRMRGRAIEATDGQGWAWFELDRVDPARGGSPRRETDALRLMAVVLGHWDNKAANQRLVCPPEADRPDGTCAAPLAIIQDLGAEFGPRKVDLARWTRLPVWADAGTCRVSMRRMPWAGGTFPDWQISEAGRMFLLGLLDQLSPAQLETLFSASRITALPGLSREARDPAGWAAAFRSKVRQIREAGPCGP